jgi:hypothetical protein
LLRRDGYGRILGERAGDEEVGRGEDGPGRDRRGGEETNGGQAYSDVRKDAKGEGDAAGAGGSSWGAEGASVHRGGGEPGEPEASGIRSTVEPELHDMVDDVRGECNGGEGVPFFSLSGEKRAGH